MKRFLKNLIATLLVLACLAPIPAANSASSGAAKKPFIGTSHFHTYALDNVFPVIDITIWMKKLKQPVNGLEIPLKGLPPLYWQALNVNMSGWNASGWSCEKLKDILRCQGKEILKLNAKSAFVFYFSSLEDLRLLPRSKFTIYFLSNGKRVKTENLPQTPKKFLED